MIRMLQRRTHQVLTRSDGYFAGWSQEKEICFAETTHVHVYPMTEEQIRDYVASGEPMDKAGAYGIQGLFAAYVSGIEGDYNNVVGAPGRAALPGGAGSRHRS